MQKQREVVEIISRHVHYNKSRKLRTPAIKRRKEAEDLLINEALDENKELEIESCYLKMKVSKFKQWITEHREETKRVKKEIEVKKTRSKG